MPIFCVKSVKIYTGQIKFTRVYLWLSWQISGMLRLICHWHQCAVTATPIPRLAVLYHLISPAELSWVHFPMTADDPALPCHPDNTSPDGEYLYSGDTSPHPQICIPPPVCVETPTLSHQEAMWHQISLNGKPPAGGISGETLTNRIHEGEIFRAGLKFWRLVSSISTFKSPALDERKQGVD